MYIIGAVEILMVYIVGPQMSLFGPDISIDSVKFNNFRVYGTFFVMSMYIFFWKPCKGYKNLKHHFNLIVRTENWKGNLNSLIILRK